MLYKDLGDMDQEALVYVKLGDSYSMSMELHSMTVAEEYYLQACIDSVNLDRRSRGLEVLWFKEGG
jgi:hypothetical protein